MTFFNNTSKQFGIVDAVVVIIPCSLCIVSFNFSNFTIISLAEREIISLLSICPTVSILKSNESAIKESFPSDSADEKNQKED